MYDMKNLTKLKKLGELAPEAFKGFVAFDEAEHVLRRPLVHGHGPPGDPANALDLKITAWSPPFQQRQTLKIRRTLSRSSNRASSKACISV